jgi:hypothetical protein
VNASLALCAAVLSALPAAEPSQTQSLRFTAYSEQYAAVIRGQSPGPELTTPMLTVPSGIQEQTVLQPTPDGGYPGVAPTYAAPTYAAPSVGADPYLTDPGYYIPGGPVQAGRWGWYAGYDNVFLIPHFKHNAGSIVASAANNNATIQNIEWDFKYSPRVWVGLVEPDGTGVVGRWFMFDHSSRDGGGQHDIDMYTIDLEKVWHHNTTRGAVTASGGFRYASVEQELSTATNIGGALGSTHTDTGFHGVGPTIALNGRHRIANSAWNLFAGARFSVLYGSSSTAVSTPLPATAVAYEEGDDLMAVTDLQIGLDWSTHLCYTTRLFFRVAAEGQFWYGGVNSNAYNAQVAAPLLDGNFGLFGFTVGTGFAY